MAFDDCLMICENGNLAECSRSNIWLVFGNTVVTPKGNNLRGITRKQLNVAMGDAFTVRLFKQDLKNVSRSMCIFKIPFKIFKPLFQETFGK